MDSALVAGSTEEGGVVAEVNAARQTSNGVQRGDLCYKAPAHHTYTLLTSTGWQGQCLFEAPPAFPWTGCQKAE